MKAIGIHLEAVVGNRRGFARLRNLVQAFSELEHELPFVLFADAPNLVREWGLGSNFRVDSLGQLRGLHRRYPRFLARLRYHRLAVMHFPTAEVWHTAGCPTVVTLHDLAPLYFPEAFFTHREARQQYLRHLETIRRNATVLATVSEYSRGEIARHFNLPPEQIAVIYQGYEPFPPQSPAAIEQVLRRYALEPGYVFYVGGLDVRKNLGTLIRAMAELRQAGRKETLVIVGGRPSTDRRMFPDWQRDVIQCGAEPVRWLGYVPEADLPALLHGCGVFAYPSRMEGFGYPPLEAMACAAPVVCSNAAALPETCGQGALLLDPDAPAAWAAALRRVLNNTALREKLVVAGRQNLKRFDWKNTARGFLELYRKIASAR